MGDEVAIEGVIKCVLLVEAAGLAREGGALLSRDLGNGAAGGQVATQDLDVAGGLDGVR